MSLGVLYSLTGATSITELGQWNATMLAITEFNETNEKYFIEAEVIDIESNPQIAVQKIEPLLERGIRLFIGTYTSACRERIQEKLETYNGLLFYPAQYEGGDQHPNVVYCGSVPNQQMLDYISWSIRNLGKKVFIVGSTYQYSVELTNVMNQLCYEHDGQIVGEYYIELGTNYFDPIFRAIETEKPDFIFTSIVGESAISFYDAYNKMGLTYPLISTVMSESELTALSTPVTADYYASFPYFSSIQSLENNRFTKAYQQVYKYEPISSLVENAYVAVKFLTEALLLIESVSVNHLRQVLSQVIIDAPQGRISFDPVTQHMTQWMRIGRWNKQGNFDIIYDKGKAIVAEPFKFKEPKKRYNAEDIEVVIRMLNQFPIEFAIYQRHGQIIETNVIDDITTTSLWYDAKAFRAEQLHESQLKRMMNGTYSLSYPVYKYDQLLFVIVMVLPDVSYSKEMAQLLSLSLSQLFQMHFEHVQKMMGQLLSYQLLRHFSNQSSFSLYVLREGTLIYSNEQAKLLKRTKRTLIECVLKQEKKEIEDKYIYKSVFGEIYEIERVRNGQLTYLYVKEIFSPMLQYTISNENVSFRSLIGKDSRYCVAISIAQKLSGNSEPALLLGEKGTGKEHFARVIHYESKRGNQPFVTFNCTDIAPEFIEAELMGVDIKGDDGENLSIGLMEKANGGTLYIDEIDELPLFIQTILMRVLNEKQFVPIGGQRVIPLDVRIIASTRRHLEHEIAYNGSFINDLYELFNKQKLILPSLKERDKDIVLLAQSFLDELSEKNHRHRKKISSEFVQALLSYAWPENIRELQMVIERVFYFADYETTISLEHLPRNILMSYMKTEHQSGRHHINSDKDEQMEEILQELIRQRGNISKTSQALGLSRTTLYRKLEQYNKVND